MSLGSPTKESNSLDHQTILSEGIKRAVEVAVADLS